MKFSTREDIEAPQDYVWQRVSDFDGFERAAMRRGVELRKRAAFSHPDAETGWEVAFEYRNKRRQVAIELVNFEPKNTIGFVALSPSLEADIGIDLLPLSRHKTRLSFAIDVRPKSIKGRLTIQSLKLAKANMMRRFRLRVAGFCSDIEDGFKNR